MNSHYVYIHRDPSTFEVKWVGKGKKNRAYDFYLKRRTGRHREWLSSILEKKLVPVVELLSEHLSEEEAFALEVEKIAEFRKLGFPLLNLADGGKGKLGYGATSETRKRMAAARAGKKFTDEHRKNLSIGQRSRSDSKKYQNDGSFVKGGTSWNKGLPKEMQPRFGKKKVRTEAETLAIRQYKLDWYHKNKKSKEDACQSTR